MPRLVTNFWYPSQCLYFTGSKDVNFFCLSILSCLQSSDTSSVISLSDTLRKRCRLSITTCVRGIDGKMGQFDTLYFLRDFGSWESERFSSIVRAPAVGSEMDHSFSVSNLSLVLHLHHMQAYSLEAASIPVTIARNFQSPPR